MVQIPKQIYYNYNIQAYSPMQNTNKPSKISSGINGCFMNKNSGNKSYYDAYCSSYILNNRQKVSENKLFTSAPYIESVKKYPLKYNPMSGISKNRVFDFKTTNNSSKEYNRFVMVIIEVGNFIKTKIGSFFT